MTSLGEMRQVTPFTIGAIVTFPMGSPEQLRDF